MAHELGKLEHQYTSTDQKHSGLQEILNTLARVHQKGVGMYTVTFQRYIFHKNQCLCTSSVLKLFENI